MSCKYNKGKLKERKRKWTQKKKILSTSPCLSHTSHLLCWCLSLANWKNQLGVSKAGLWSSFYCADNINIGRKTKVAWQWAVVPKGHKRLFTETESEAPHFISGFPIPLSPFPCAPESLSVCPCRGIFQTYRSSPATLGTLTGEGKKKSPALFFSRFCRRIASWNLGIVRSSRSWAQPASKDYPRSRKEKVGGWGG